MQMKRVLAVASVLAGTVLVSTSARAGGANDRLDAEFVVEDTECANRGGAHPKASYTRTCRGVFEMWSSPRMTSVMDINWSSMTTA